MRAGFIGLGNVGSKLAGSLLRNGFDLVVRDLDRPAAAALEAGGAGWADSPAEMAAEADMVTTCLPSPAVSAAVMEAGDGILAGLACRAGRGNDGEAPIWAEMSTTDEAEVRRLAALAAEAGGAAASTTLRPATDPGNGRPTWSSAWRRPLASRYWRRASPLRCSTTSPRPRPPTAR